MQYVETGEKAVDVLVMVPQARGQTRYTMFEIALQDMQAPLGSNLARIQGISGIAAGVNQVIKTTKASYYWFIDDDHWFDVQVLLKLLRHKLPVVVAVTMMKEPPFTPVIIQGIKKDDEGFEQHIPYQLIDMTNKYGLQPIFASGRPGMLVAREVFEKIPPPWFILGHFNPEYPAEDLYFCKLLREHGIQLFADFDTFTGHIGPVAIIPHRLPDGRVVPALRWDNGKMVILGRA
jgi:hypothetical protein